MRVLLIGGSKFIGFNLLLKLLEDNHNITVLNDDYSCSVLPSKVRHIKGNRKDRRLIEQLFESNSFDIVFDTCGFEPQDIEIVLECSKKRIGQYIFCSTTSVYDFDKIKCYPIKEEFPLKNAPESSNFEVRYGSNKALCEGRLLSNQYFPVTIIRPCYVYGPYAYDYRVEYFLDRVIDGRMVLIPPIAHNIVHFIHVYDLVGMFISAIGNEKAYNRIYNAAGDETTTIYNFIRLCGDVVGKKVDVKIYNPHKLSNILTDDEIAKITPTKVYPFSLYFDNFMSKTELNWSPALKLLEGLENTYEWYVTNSRKEPNYSIDDKAIDFLEY